jgi:tricorn protease
MNYWALLDDTVDRTTILKVASDQEGTDAREVSLAPVSWSGGNPLTTPYYNMLYMDWVEQKRAVVDIQSDNLIGYIHIPIMYGDQLEQFARDLYSKSYDKEALIIDVRFNSGGNIHEQLLDILSRPQFAWAGTRDDELRPQPSQRWDRPIVLLINEDSFSDAEIFPAGFRALGLGTIIGQTTAGGVIGTWNIALVDGVTVIRIPKRGWYTMDDENMENLGIEPDIRVVQDLNHIRDGIDDQLNYAITYLMDRI